MPPSQTSPIRLESSERRAAILDLRRGGATLQQIADRFGISTSRVHQVVKEEMLRLADMRRESAEALIQEEDERLLAMLRVAYGTAMNTDRPIEMRLKAVDRVLKVSEARRKLHGLDAPEKVAQVNPDGSPLTGPTDEQRAQALAELLARLVQTGRPSPVTVDVLPTPALPAQALPAVAGDPFGDGPDNDTDDPDDDDDEP